MSALQPADPVSAVAGYLLEAVGELVEGRVFSPELPQVDDKTMPQACIVVSGDGGYSLFGDSYLPVGDPRIAIRCYGSTRLESDNVGRACLLAMKNLHNGTWEGVRLQWARIVSGLLPMVDSETLWSFSLFTTQVMCDEWVSP